MGFRSPVSSANPTTSDEDTSLERVSLIPTARSSKWRTCSSSMVGWASIHREVGQHAVRGMPLQWLSARPPHRPENPNLHKHYSLQEASRCEDQHWDDCIHIGRRDQARVEVPPHTPRRERDHPRRPYFRPTARGNFVAREGGVCATSVTPPETRPGSALRPK